MSESTATPDKKEYKAPVGAQSEMQWTPEKGKSVEIEVTSEWIVLRKNEKPAAEIFHTYYRPTESKTKRPITFVFNGGPGAASAYLHLGGLSPQRVQFKSDGGILPPPVQVLNNTESWIEFTDLVFIDPVGTGFSRVIEAEKPNEKEKPDPLKVVDEKEFYALKRDLESMGEFIERFLSKHKLWDVPVYLAGESYGGFRTAKLARLLQEKHGVGLTAVIAISPALEWSLLMDGDYDVLRSIDTFCSMALAAAHHKKSRIFQKGESIEVMRKQIERFATRELAHALTVGSAHDERELAEVVSKTADYLGLPLSLVKRSHGRMPFWRFARELLRDDQRVVGFYDATITAIDPYPDREMHQAPDPTLISIERVFASGINQVLRAQIGIETDRRYELLNEMVFTSWKRDDNLSPMDTLVGAIDDLRYAMSLNPDMKVLICHGYYDLVTPYFSSERLVEQMKLLPEQRRNLELKHFSGGHMFYTWDDSRRAARDWVRGYYP